MNAPLIARIAGALLLLAGIAGFVPWLAPAAPFDAPVVSLDTAYRFIGGTFPVNIVVDVANLIFGLSALVAAQWFTVAARCCAVTAVWYFVLVLLGAIPITSTFFGVAPLYGYGVLFNAVVATIAFLGSRGHQVEEERLQPG